MGSTVRHMLMRRTREAEDETKQKHFRQFEIICCQVRSWRHCEPTTTYVTSSFNSSTSISC